MPDTDFQRIVLNLIPKKGDEPVIFYASQYETARPFIADLMWGDTEFTPGDDCWAEIDIRKNDDNLVVITDDVNIDNNEVSVVLPVQAVTCIGKNLGQIKIYADVDNLIAALNFILEVQPDPLAGGVTSETAIDNLETQIAAIVPEVIGDDYYDKTEVDALLADKADVSDLPDMSQYYTKTATDTLLNAKADKTDTYTKAQVDSALALKADTSSLATVATSGDYDDLINKPIIPAAQVQSDYTQADVTAVDYIKNKPDIDAMIAAALLAVMPVDSATGNPCSFDTDIATSLVDLSAEITASGGGGTPSTPIPIVGISSLDIVRCGKNFISDYDTQLPVSGQGVSFSKNSDGTYKTVASADKIGYPFARLCKVTLPAGTYTLTAGTITGLDYRAVNRNVSPVVVYQRTFTLTETTELSIEITVNASQIAVGEYNTEIQLEVGNTASTFAPYNGQTFTIDLGGTRYGGTYTADGKLVVTHANIASYNGESINEPWLSSIDTYVPNTTPTIGAQVVYPLTTPIEIDVSAISVNAISGVNNISSNGGGDITAQYKVSIQKYIDDHV